MVHPKERTLKQLYNGTDSIMEPKITPVLKGSCRMQGPTDETYHDTRADMVSSRGEKGFDRCSKSQKVDVKAESGTCNVCAAPCSSCLHISRVLMGSKTDEFSDETCRENALSHYSVTKVLPPVKSSACDNDHQHTASEASNLFCVNSSHDSFSENAESKASLRPSDVSGASVDVEMLPKLSIGAAVAGDQRPIDPEYKSDQRTLANKFENPKGLEDHDDNSSGVNGVNNANKFGSYDNEIADRMSVPCSGQRSDSDRYHDIGNRKVSHVEGNYEVAEKNSPNLEAETGNASGNLPAEALNLSKQIDDVKKFKQSPVSSDTQDTSLLSQPSDVSDESDMVEHDVKVCDICGDAGREDLLAICSRCSDGAEHTYCMSDMLDKVPEGDWMCEECKFDEEIKNSKHDKCAVDWNEKKRFSGLATNVNTNSFVKLDIKDSDVEGNRVNIDTPSAKTSGKRHADDREVGSAPKRQALETMTGSPRTSNSNLSRLASLSRDSSFKNLDKGKMKPGHQSSSGTHSISDMPETAGARLQTPRGSLVKSDSFNSSNGKPKGKLVDEVVLQKQKSARELVSLDTKEGAVRLMGKSMSFRSANSGRLNTSESKVKMLSPKFSHVQDLKGIKEAKDQNLFERKNSFRSERLCVSSTAASSPIPATKVDQKPLGRGETQLLSSTNNIRVSKAVQSDSKSTTLSKGTNRVARRGSEMPGPLGERKSRMVGASSSFAEQTPNQISPKDTHSPNTSEAPFCNVNESLPEGFPRIRESTNPVERIRDNSVDGSRQNVIADGRGIPCDKCKEIGHAAQFCTVDRNRPLAIDASAVRSSREVINGGNRLKAAIEAAMLKKPGIYRKNRAPDQHDELATSSTNVNCERASQDQRSSSLSKIKNILTADEVHEGQAIPPRNSTAGSCNQATANNIKQLPALPIEDLNSIAADTGEVKPFMRDLPCHGSAAMSVLSKISTIPEYEYIWQGRFEINKSGILPQFCDGVQAHLSTCASPKVIEVANKFPYKVQLNEVPRLSTWPIQFQERGVKEDNVALYFFAKDLASYEKSYKRLLENMMKSDIALQGSFDGVELLIFPSNQLPEKSQRWNMLFFLWGVFRVKRVVDCSQQVSGSPSKVYNTKDVKIFSRGPMDKDVSIANQSCNVPVSHQAPALTELPCLSAEVNGDHGVQVSSVDPNSQHVQANMGLYDCRDYSTSLSRIQMSNAASSPQKRLTSPLLEKHVDLKSELDADPQPCVQATAGTVSGCNDSEKMPLPWDAPLERQQDSSQSLKIPPTIRSQEGGAIGSVGVPRKTPSILHSSNDQVKVEWNLEEEEGSLDAESTTLEREMMKRDETVKGRINTWQFNDRKHPLNDPPEIVSFAGSASKKQKTGFSGFYVCESSSRGIPGFGTSSPIKDEKWDEACEEIVKPERHFFPVEPPRLKGFGLGDNLVPWEALSSKDNGLHDLAPNLELALGAEAKPLSKPGMLPFLLVSKVEDKKNDDDDDEEHHHPQESLATKGEEDNVSASLSLSLSFPFPDKEQTAKAVSETEQQLLSERRRHTNNTSLLLFGGLSDK